MTKPTTLSHVPNATVSNRDGHPFAAQAVPYRGRFEGVEPPTDGSFEESLVVDARSALSPAQVVESRLTRKLGAAALPVSHLQMRGLLRNR